MENQLFLSQYAIGKRERQRLNGHKSFMIWITGLSGSGKSTLANALERILFASHVRTYVLDGDHIRYGLCKDLGFSDTDRKENIRRLGETAKVFVDAGKVVLVAAISPFRQSREAVRQSVGPDEFFEVYLKCPLEVCERRDPKGLYKKARQGEIKSFTGIGSIYEEPVHPEVVLDTAKHSVEESIRIILEVLRQRQMIPTD